MQSIAIYFSLGSSYVATSETLSESTVIVLSNYMMNTMIKVMNLRK